MRKQGSDLGCHAMRPHPFHPSTQTAVQGSWAHQCLLRASALLTTPCPLKAADHTLHQGVAGLVSTVGPAGLFWAGNPCVQPRQGVMKGEPKNGLSTGNKAL